MATLVKMELWTWLTAKTCHRSTKACQSSYGVKRWKGRMLNPRDLKRSS